MSNLMASLATVAESMRTVQKSIELTSNNVANSKSPGYVKQSLALVAKRFEVQNGLAGGVEDAGIISARKEYLETGVRDQASQKAKYDQQAAGLERIEPLFDISSGSGLGGSIDALFKSFSELSISPNDAPARQRTIETAKDLAASFRFASSALGAATTGGQTEINSVVSKINRLGELVQTYNREVRTDHRKLEDPGLEAQVHATLEDLSNLVGIQVVSGNEGSLQVLVGGQTTLTVGENLYPLSADFSTGKAVIRDAAGQDISANITSGQLGGALDFQNNIATDLSSRLDTLAKTLADRVNTTLASGLDQNGQPGAALFVYDPTKSAASTLAANTLTPDQLATAVPSAPGGNGNALALADLGNSKQIQGTSFSQYYGEAAGSLGRLLANARQDSKTHDLLLSQARNLRSNDTAVNLDEEAANLIAFQRQYEANAELVRVLNNLTETMLGILR
ncbi:MAG: flagellar hook-associated protein FlgK [Bryobacteraceae bacterium]